METLCDCFATSTTSTDNGRFATDIPYMQARDLIGDFCSSVVDFLLEPLRIEGESPQERTKTARFVMGFPLHQSLRKGAVSFGYYCGGSDSSLLESCVVLREEAKEQKKSSSFSIPFVDSFSSFFANAIAYYKMSKCDSMPSVFFQRQKMTTFFRVASSLSDKTEEWHAKHCNNDEKNNNHYEIVQLAAVNDEAKLKLLKRLVAVAKMPIYCHAVCEDADLLEQVGFLRIGQEVFMDPNDEERTLKVDCRLWKPTATTSTL